MSKFDSRRDEALYAMSMEGWANDSSGTAEAPTGWFCKITNTAAEMSEVRDAFSDFSDVADADLIGFFLCVENDQGFWNVTTLPSQQALNNAFNTLVEEYAKWDAS